MEFLYHYKPFRQDENHKQQDLARIARVILNHEIYFSSVKDFNDPFDCKPRYVANKGDFLPWVENIRNSGNNIHTQEIWDAIIKRWDKGDVTEETVCSPLRESIPKDIEERNGVFCLSSDCHNILMWSHYASSHTGVCFKFLASPGTFFGQAKQVRYQENRPTVSIFSRDFPKIVEDTFLTKNINWQYENEFRLVGGSQIKPGIYEFPKYLLKGLILGNKMDLEQESTLKTIVKGVGGIQLHKAYLSSDKYSMDIKEI